MSDEQDRFQTLRDIVASIDPMQSNADWGRAFGRLVYETDDDDLIVYVLSDAGESYRTRELARRRKKARSAAHRLIAATNGDRVVAIAQQLDLPIVVPGFPPLPLGMTNHLFLVPACASARRFLKGFLQNLGVMERARDVSEPWPDTPIETLVADGRVTPEQLVSEGVAA